jgi:two-component system, OmpR family, sensor histidine kinase BaeS
MKRRTLAARVAAAAMLVSALSVAVIAAGVLLVGQSTFDRLMMAHGATAQVSQAMFNESITRVLLVAAGLAIAGSLGLALVFGRMIERPLSEVARAARQVAAGNYRARVERPDSRELASVADSFNQMATALEDQERERRELIENFAHELRTPLTNLRGYLEALRDEVVPPGPDAFASLGEEVARLMRLSASLDVLARGDGPGQGAEDLDLVPIINALLELNRPRFRRRQLRLEVDVPASMSVRADPDSLAQVIGNLLQNACAYSPAGGTIWVRAAKEPDTVVVAVANTGPGIPAADLEHVFERFYRVEKSRAVESGGAGIGLAIVKQLVEGVGGQVGVESAAGVNRFWFRLPT